MIRSISFFTACIALTLVSVCQTSHVNLSSIDPGKYDSTWYNHTPLRFIQTNLNEIDGKMDVDLFVKSVVDISANFLILNVGGIVANYPTKLPYHFKNPYLTGDMVGETVRKLHDHGIRVIGRFDFSKIDESIASKKPEWLYVGTDGKNVNYNGEVHTCINGGYQQEYGFKILKEAITNYPLDAIFFNMGGYQTVDYSQVEHGICQCENCKKRFHDSTGLTLPVKADLSSDTYRKYKAFQAVTSKELYGKINSFVKSLNPKLVLVQEAGELIRSESGTSFTSATDWNYHATQNVKRVLGSYRDKTPNDTYNYLMGMDFRHTATSPNIGKIYVLEQMLNGASPGIYIMGRLENQYDRVFLPTLRELYQFHKINEKLFTNLKPLTSVALVMGSTQEFRGIMKLLIEEHIMFDLIQPSSVGSEEAPRNLGGYDAVILANVADMDDRLVSVIDNYVKNGGKLLTTGFPGINDGIGTPLKSIRLQSLGVKPDFQKFPQTMSTYLKVSQQDRSALGEKGFADFDLIMMYSEFLKCKTAGNARSYLKLVANTMFGPPEKSYYSDDNVTEFPGLVTNEYGRGKSVFIPWQLGAQYAWKGNNAHRELFLSALQTLLKVEQPMQTDASPLIEITRMANRNGAFEWVGMINHSGQLGAAFREPVSIQNTTIRFKPQKEVMAIKLMKAGEELKFKQSAGWVECVVPQIRDFEMLVCVYK